MLPLCIAICITVLDQATKFWVRESYALGHTQIIIPGFMNLTYLRNTGAAWGMLGGQSMLLSILSVVMLVVLVVFRRSILSDSRIHRVALGLMIGGILGNLLDRICFGWVTDFLDFYIGNHHWPAFNVADSAICVGVGLYVISSWWTARAEPSGDAPEETVESES
jgi:signal peptidase II